MSENSTQALMLTHRSIESLAPKPKAYRVRDLRCRGLAIRVAPTGEKTWDLAFRVKGRGYRRMSLGNFRDVNLEKARSRANELTSAAREGRDLVAEREEIKKADENETNVESFLQIYSKRRLEGRLRTAHEIKLRLDRTLRTLLKKRLSAVTKQDLRKIIDNVIDRGKLREAEQQRVTLSSMFKWAFSQGYIESDPTNGLTPCSKVHFRDRVLDESEIALLWSTLDTGVLPADHSDVLRLQLCTGARCGEIAGMTVSEVDRLNWLWTLPEARSKNGRARMTPVVGIAREIIQKRLNRVAEGPLFHALNGAPLRTGHLSSYLKKYRTKFPIGHFTTHDLRRTVATRLIELGISLEIAATVIGHEAGSAEVRTLVRHYVRTDRLAQKAEALAVWDHYLAKTVQFPDNLVPLRRHVRG